MYPLLTEYIEAIKSSQDNLDALKHLRPVLDSDGNPVMTGGNFAEVFKMKDDETGKHYALKCFLRDQERRSESYRLITDELSKVDSPYLTTIKYLDKELFVDSRSTTDTEFPVLLMDWVDGVNLDKYVRDHIDDQYELSMLAYRFSQLAMWLLTQPFAHGDLKQDNILVKEDGSLVLVDYDGMYVPAMKGQLARELGSPDFRHPLRTESTFNEHIDDFSVVSILLSLKAIAVKPSLLKQYGAADRLLFCERDYRDPNNSEVLKALHSIVDTELSSLCDVFTIALNGQVISKESFQLLVIKRIEIEETDFSDANEYIPIYDPSFSYDYKIKDKRYIDDISWDEKMLWFEEQYPNYLVLRGPIVSTLKKGDKFWLLKQMPSIYTKSVCKQGEVREISWVCISTTIGKIPFIFFKSLLVSIRYLYLKYYGVELIVTEAKNGVRMVMPHNQNSRPYFIRFSKIALDEAYKYLSKEQYEKDELAFREQELPSHNGHKYVDLGLSVKWATCNVGANRSEEYGESYAWGEISSKTEYTRSNYKQSTLYNPVIILDNIWWNITKLAPYDDVAHCKWGGNWRMPTKEELEELIGNCDCLWTTQNNVKGLKITSRKPGYRDQYIFLPAAGIQSGSEHMYGLESGQYWTSSLIAAIQHQRNSYIFWFNKTFHEVSNCEKYIGLTIRPVCT